jgi:hypothetical protein
MLQGSKNVANIATPAELRRIHADINVLHENMNIKENTQVKLIAWKVVTPQGPEKKESL